MLLLAGESGTLVADDFLRANFLHRLVAKNKKWRKTYMAKSKQAFDKKKEAENLTINQGYVREEDLTPESEEKNVMTTGDVDSYAQKAKSGVGTKSGEMQGEGDYESAEDYNDSATDFAQRKGENRKLP